MCPSASHVINLSALLIGGGDPKYGNENFLNNTEKWAESILDFPEYVVHTSGTGHKTNS